jgi:hypothetical protein
MDSKPRQTQRWIKMKTAKLNKLPPGALAISPPVEKKLSIFIPQTMDASLVRNGVTWYRVQGGFSGRGDREDWIADLLFSCCVSDYNWRRYENDTFSQFFGSFTNALDRKLIQAAAHQREKVCKLRAQADELEKLLRRIGLWGADG